MIDAHRGSIWMRAALSALVVGVATAVPGAMAGEAAMQQMTAGQQLTGGAEMNDSANDHDDSDGKRRWLAKLAGLARKSLVNVEEYTDVAWNRFSERLGINEPRFIANYSGYGNADEIWVTGRLLANKPFGGPMEDDDWFDNLQATYKRWHSREIAHAPVVLSYKGQTRRVMTDDEGYYSASFRRDGYAGGRDSVLAEYRPEDDEPFSALHTIYGPSKTSQLMIISDMDDTVIHTGITDILLAAQLTFLNNARTRKPLTGVGSLYDALRDGPNGGQKNPVFYVSNSAWNMYDLLRDFVELNDIPPGPLLLRDIGFHAEGEGSENHKIDTVRRLLTRFDKLPAVLVGDSGQHDADIYQAIVKEFPDRILAVYIRDVDPDEDSAFDARVDGIISTAGDAVPFLRVADSTLIAEHAHSLGLLSTEQVAAITADSSLDKQRDTVAEEAIEEALPGDLPEN